MRQYLEGLEYILEHGEDHDDRTGVGTKSVFGYQMRFDLSEGFPAVTTKTLAWKGVVSELLWFLEGSTDERRLAEIRFGKDRSLLDEKRTIWTDNADNQGVSLGYTNNKLCKQLGPVYGYQWRNNTDQIQTVVDQLKNEPESRRIILSAWNPKSIPHMALPPCHVLCHFKVSGNRLNCLLYQRSADAFLGVPFNIASYSLLTHMLADHVGLEVGQFVHSIGDFHIYKNHLDAVNEQLNRTPRGLPTLDIPDIESFNVDYISNLDLNDFKLKNYDPLPTIKAKMAI